MKIINIIFINFYLCRCVCVCFHEYRAHVIPLETRRGQKIPSSGCELPNVDTGNQNLVFQDRVFLTAESFSKHIFIFFLILNDNTENCFPDTLLIAGRKDIPFGNILHSLRTSAYFRNSNSWNFIFWKNNFKIFWDYKIITSLDFSVPLRKTSLVTHLTLFQIDTLFFFNFCVCSQTYKYALIKIHNVTCVCMFSGMTIWYGIIIWVLLHEEEYLSHSQHICKCFISSGILAFSFPCVVVT